MKKILGILFSLIIVFNSLSTPVNAAVIDHDKVVGFKEISQPQTITQKTALRFKPYLKVKHGCVPFPAVDKYGNTSGGLKPTGGHSEYCSKSEGQVYSRSTWYNGVWAIMYSWYFPKDSPSSGLGHRHDWECIVVWIDNPDTANPKILDIAYSGHGNFTHSSAHNNNMKGTHPLVAYDDQWPINHSLDQTSSVGGMQPLIGWDDLTKAARDALNNTDFGSANVPFKESNFFNNLNKAWFK